VNTGDREDSTIKQLGLIVEDQSDADVLQEIARKIAKKNFAVKRILAYGCGKMQAKARAWAQQLQKKGCSLLVLACDLDNRQLAEVSRSLREALAPCPIGNYVVVIPVREIEAWLLADHDAVTNALALRRRLGRQSNPEAIIDPKSRLRRLVSERSAGAVIYLNTVHNAKIARHAQVENLRRCSSFLAFEDFVRKHLC
jgi:hypothetical protein